MNDERKDNLAEKWGKTLYDIIRAFELEDEVARSYHLRVAKLGEYYFRGFQNVYWDATANDYLNFSDSPDATEDDAHYSKVVNIYRAHGEAIIAAMTVDVPIISFVPDNSEDANDVRTAQNYTNASLLLQRHNAAPLLFIRAVYLLWTQGFIAAYNYNHTSEEYGFTESDKYGESEVDVASYTCPSCGYDLGGPENLNQTPTQEVQFTEDGSESIAEGKRTECPNCGEQVEPEETVTKDKILRIIGKTREPKSRECLEVYGMSHIKVAPYATTQAATPYLVFESEEHLSKIRFDYRFDAAPYGDSDSFDEKAARQPQMLESLEGHTATVKKVWLRPSALFFNSTDEGEELLKDFPDGAHCVFVNTSCLKARPENLDDHWTLFEHPTSSHVHPDPMGKPLIEINDIENEITNLTLQTMEQGISQTFVHSEALDFEKYRATESKPGQMYPVNVPIGGSVPGMFYTTKTAIMSQEIDKFSMRNQENGRFVVGSYPSLYGGSIQGGSKTYSEYAASRQMALQRLMTPYKALSAWWAKVMGKAVPEYVSNLDEDVRFSVKEGALSLNKVIKADIDAGRIGSVEPDASGSFPLTWQQKRDVLMELVKMNLPEINEAILTPENAVFLTQLIGLPELNLPGQQSRLKQFMEIQQLLMSGPSTPEISTVPVDMDVDDHMTEARVCRDVLQSQAGLDLIDSNPEGRANILAHLKEHMAAMQGPVAGSPSSEQPEANSGAMPVPPPAMVQ